MQTSSRRRSQEQAAGQEEVSVRRSQEVSGGLRMQTSSRRRSQEQAAGQEEVSGCRPPPGGGLRRSQDADLLQEEVSGGLRM
ncbi:hypothetical protein EYF80_042737 [Liparis tanakae]|uniref:Uncharacterized protein n=1 Tax=Liparis tanakae TaxID=230148 RepID=A0A4Z2G2E1_9TELE|nr:hypothetical protein EYF80_042737 [Liparis tanakae]